MPTLADLLRRFIGRWRIAVTGGNWATDALRAARARVAAGWTQDVYARDASGKKVPDSSPAAVCFCPLGALNAGLFCQAAYTALIAALPTQPTTTDYLCRVAAVAEWNDVPGRTQAEVLDLYDRAIAIAGAA